MDIKTHQAAIQDVKADAIIVNLFEGVTQPGGATGAVDQALSGAISALIESGDLKGKVGEVAVLYPRGAMPARRVLVTGLGKAEEFTLEQGRRAVAGACRKARALGARSIASIVHAAGSGGREVEAAAQASVEGAILGLYEFNVHKNQPADYAPVETFSLVEVDRGRLSAVESGAQIGRIVAEAANLARDMVNQPANYMTPSLLAEAAQQAAAQSGLACQVYDEAWMREQKMGALLGVTQGSEEPARFIVLEHGRGRSKNPLIFVGKGLTFDSGGISIKPSENMDAMKSDMGGGAAVVGALKAIAQLDLPMHVVGIVPTCENLPSGRAYKPSDVLRARNGKTIEIISTDAEGRLILADALCYAAEYKPEAVVDLATLTGACVVALGRNIAAGLFCSDEGLAAKLLQAGADAGEKLWRMPLFPEYRETIKSDVADMKNSGGRTSGVGSSAIFLKEFTDYLWAHLDIAGMALIETEDKLYGKGGSGFGVRTLVALARQRQE